MSSLSSSVRSSVTASASSRTTAATTTTTARFSSSSSSPAFPPSSTMSSSSSSPSPALPSSPAPSPSSSSLSRTSTSSFVFSPSVVPPPSSSTFSSPSSRSTLFSSSIQPTPTFSSSSPTLPSSSHSIPSSSVVSQTLIPPPTSTLSAPIFVTVTDNSGALTTSAPSAFTSFSTSTANNGSLVTVTQIIANPSPTLSPNNISSKSSTFFKNTGAVVGIFVLVGLAAASILLWIFFAVRRRRRTQRLEHDTAVSATLAAAGFHRTPVDDDDDLGVRSRYESPDVLMYQRRSTPSAGRLSAAYLDGAPQNADPEGGYQPYTDYVVPPGAREGYIPGNRASTPPTAFHMGAYHDRRGSGSGGDMIRHSASYSGGSYEPLLANYRQTGTQSPSLPPRNPKRLSDAATQRAALPENVRPVSAASSVYSSESTGDDRLDPGLRQRMGDGGSVKDEEDYSRPVLGVRNLPDAPSDAPVA